MNLYKLHTNPEKLDGYKEDSVVPLLASIANELKSRNEFIDANIMVEIQEYPVDIQTSTIIKNTIINAVMSDQATEYLIVLYVEEILKERWIMVEGLLQDADSKWIWEEYKQVLAMNGIHI